MKIVKEIREFCPGVSFGDLGRYQFIVGPFEYLCKLLIIVYMWVFVSMCGTVSFLVSVASRCIESIFQHVISTRQLDTSWLSLLIVTHLRTIDFSAFPSAVNMALFKILKQRCKV